jgi:tripartite-type tricarboxylate transporter receptor subunit TctC
MPGAGGITSVNRLVRSTEPNGLTMIMGSNTTMDPLVYRTANAQYDPKTIRMIGGVGRGGTLIFVSKEAEPRLYDKKANPVIIGNVGAMPRVAMMPAIWGIEYLGWNAKWIVGYPGTNELMLAYDRGEIELASTGVVAQIADRLKNGSMKILNQSGSLENGKIVGRPDFGNAPIFPEQIKDKKIDDLGQKAVDYWFALSNLDKWLGLAPGTPDNIVHAYREAFIKARADKDFIEQGQKLSDGFEPSSAEDVEAYARTLADTTPETLEFMLGLMRKQGLQVQ